VAGRCGRVAGAVHAQVLGARGRGRRRGVESFVVATALWTWLLGVVCCVGFGVWRRCGR